MNDFIKKYYEELFVFFTYKSGEGIISSFLKDRLRLIVPAFSKPEEIVEFRGQWKYKDDKHGTIIRIYGNVFDKVNDIFLSVLGPPPFSCEKNVHGYPQVGYYGENHRGYHLQYSQEAKFVEIVCIGKMSRP